MNGSNVFNINKGDLTRFALLWNREKDKAMPIGAETLKIDHRGYSLLYVLYSTYITDNYWTYDPDTGNQPMYFYDSNYDGRILINDPNLPYPQYINQDLREAVGWRPVTIVDDGLSFGKYYNNRTEKEDSYGIIPYRIYGIR